MARRGASICGFAGRISGEGGMLVPSVRLGLAVLVVAALAACAPGSFYPAGPATAAPPPVSLDENFLDRAATGTRGEVALGELARQRGAALAVRRFGAHIAYRHRRIHARLIGLARRLGMRVSPGVSDTSRLAALSGPPFDRAFLADQLTDQREALFLFESEAQRGEIPRLRRFAREWLPLLRRDLRRAETLAARVGA
jgi:putative membrane protein